MNTLDSAAWSAWPAALDIWTLPLLGPAMLAQRQRARLTRLLQSAQAGSRLYRRTLRGLDAATATLAELPVAHKRMLMRHFADWVTDPALELGALQRLVADPARVAEPYLGRYTVWESSGSSGEPGLFVQDAAALAVYDALEALRRNSPRPLQRQLDPWYLGERIGFVGATGGHFASQVSVQRLRRQAPWLAVHWASLSILQPLPALVAQLNEFAPTILSTYPTAAVMLAAEQAAGRLQIAPQEVWTGGETLSAAMRAAVQQGFGCPLRNSYGASEFLPIAWECAHGALHVNADWVILEPVDAQHRPLPPGVLSHTTLLTNLANHVQPLIRYDLGDRSLLHAQRCACGSLLPVIEVQGRCDETLTVGGAGGRPVVLLPLALSTVLEDEAGLFDFRLEQVDARTLRLQPGNDTAPAQGRRAAQALKAFAARQGAPGLQVRVEHAAHLLRGRSGKLQRILAR